MEPLSPTQARDHIEMIDRILAQSQQRLETGGEYLAVWGIASASVTVVMQLLSQGLLPSVAFLWLPVALAGCSVFSIVRGRSMRRCLRGISVVQREFFKVLWITLGVAFIADTAAIRLFPGMAAAAIWSVAASIVLLYIGVHGNARAQIGGAIVIASLVAAAFVGDAVVGYVLAAGMLVGYAGFGVSELLAR